MKIYYRVGNLLVPHSKHPAREIKLKKEHDPLKEALKRAEKKTTEEFMRTIFYIGEEKKS